MQLQETTRMYDKPKVSAIADYVSKATPRKEDTPTPEQKQADLIEQRAQDIQKDHLYQIFQAVK